MEVETPGRTQDGNGEGSGNGDKSNSGDKNGDEDGNGNGEGGGEAIKGKKPHKTCRRHVGNGGDLGEKRKNVEKKGQ